MPQVFLHGLTLQAGAFKYSREPCGWPFQLYWCLWSALTPAFVPAITINNQEISVVEKSPVLGVLIDKDLNNVAQCNAVKAKLCYKWWQVKKYCNPNWGLKLKTVMIIVNATILPTLFYAAPSWLHTRKSLEVFNPLLYQMLTIACGSYYKPDRKTLECINGFVP